MTVARPHCRRDGSARGFGIPDCPPPVNPRDDRSPFPCRGL